MDGLFREDALYFVSLLLEPLKGSVKFESCNAAQ